MRLVEGVAPIKWKLHKDVASTTEANETSARRAAGDMSAPVVERSMWNSLGVWAAALLTLGIFSFLYRDNPYYKVSESLLIGSSAAYWMINGFWTTIVPNLFGKLAPDVVRAYASPSLPVSEHPGLDAGLAFVPLILGFMLIWIFAVTLGLTPVSGMTDGRLSPAFGSEAYWQYFASAPLVAIVDLARHLILPVSTLVIISVAGDSRYVRASVIDTLGSEHVRTARAKGLSSRRIILRHTLRTALVPFATNLGLAFPFLFGGALITETVFSWPGVGRLTLLATNGLDYPVLMAILLIGSLMVVIGNLISDLLYAILDPRVRL